MLGLMLGGLATATAVVLAAGLLSVLAETWRFAVVALFAAAAVARDFRILRLPLPAPTRQVPETVYFRGPMWSSLQFGFELGTGVRTQIPASAPYVVVAALALLNPGVAVTLAAGVAFGAGRAFMPLMRQVAQDTEAWDHLLRRRYRAVIQVAAVLSAAAVTGVGLS